MTGTVVVLSENWTSRTVPNIFQCFQAIFTDPFLLRMYRVLKLIAILSITSKLVYPLSTLRGTNI